MTLTVITELNGIRVDNQSKTYNDEGHVGCYEVKGGRGDSCALLDWLATLSPYYLDDPTMTSVLREYTYSMQV